MLREHREVCCLLSIIQQSMSLEADMRPMKVNVDGEAVEMQSEPLLITSERVTSSATSAQGGPGTNYFGGGPLVSGKHSL